MIYDISRKRSFDYLKDWQLRALMQAKEDHEDEGILFQWILLGNKCDLDHTRQVSKEEGQILAKQLNCPFFEISAKDNINVTEAFSELIRQLRQQQEMMNQPEEPEKAHCNCCSLL